ncbi:MAG: UPF0149 family protein [Caldimonas sp.]
MTINPRQPARRAGLSPRGPAAGVPEAHAARPLGEAEVAELQALLDAVPAPLEPLDVAMLDGFLCGVLLQPEPVPTARWLRHVCDVDGRPLPPGFDAARLGALCRRRHAELDEAIAHRRWFDPWVFELNDGDEQAPDSDAGADLDADFETEFDSDSDSGSGSDSDTGSDRYGLHDRGDDESDAIDDAPPSIDAVYPWVAGFATALELFPALMRLSGAALNAPLALVYRHLAAEDLEDAESLLAEIESLEPVADLDDAVEGLVRATLLLADVSRPSAAPSGGRAPKTRASGRRPPTR